MIILSLFHFQSLQLFHFQGLQELFLNLISVMSWPCDYWVLWYVQCCMLFFQSFLKTIQTKLLLGWGFMSFSKWFHSLMQQTYLTFHHLTVASETFLWTTESLSSCCGCKCILHPHLPFFSFLAWSEWSGWEMCLF